jgi:hypothetical protein
MPWPSISADPAFQRQQFFTGIAQNDARFSRRIGGWRLRAFTMLREAAA